VNYYNEFDPKAAEWLRELIKAKLIPDGFVDQRSIVDVNPYELTQYTQHHFFAGIGGWSYALRLAGWPDDKPVVTGSCPCQPFSAAGKGLGEKDERHLWPVFRNIVTFLGASVVFGEQVASSAGRDWLARVRVDLESLGYGVGAADLCAAGVNAPHIRQRLYWMANSVRIRRQARARPEQKSSNTHRLFAGDLSSSCGLGDTDGPGSFTGRQAAAPDGHGCAPVANGCAGRLEHAEGDGREQRWTESSRRSTSRGCWDMFEVVHCTDGKARRFEPGSFPLAHGVPGRVGLLRGYGNAIVPELAAEFIKASCEAIA
jgi:DNA (cytosine-5)-methyltransferase 1